MASASEQTRKRLHNQSRILDALRFAKQAQRTDLSRLLGIRNSSITSICKDLLDQQALLAVTPGAYRSPLSLNPEFWRAAVLSICDNQLTAGLVDCYGKLTHLETEKQTSSTPEFGLACATTLLKKLLSEQGVDVRGVGVSVTGVTDPENGIVRSAINLDGWEEVRFADELSAALGVPVAIRNDASCGLLGNFCFQDWGKEISSALYVCLGTGIGASYSMNGQLDAGAHFAEGDIGCLPVGGENRPCKCGKRDCLQTYCSIPALLQSLCEFDQNLKGKSFDEICAAPSSEIKAHLELQLKPLTDKITTLSVFLDPEAIILTSPSQAALPVLTEVLTRSLRCQLPHADAKPITLYQGFPTLEGVLRGAGANVFTKCFSNQSLALEAGSSPQLASSVLV